jgi:hypothetical protein
MEQLFSHDCVFAGPYLMLSFALPVAALTKVDDADEYLRSMKRMHECVCYCCIQTLNLHCGPPGT